MIRHLRSIFTRFQNLNLVVLMEDLRRHLTAAGQWESDHFLCPVAHGMPDGATVGKLGYLSQAVNLESACSYAAGVLGAHGDSVQRFIEMWDAGPYAEWLLEQLERIWQERLQDADAMQRVLHPPAEMLLPHAAVAWTLTPAGQRVLSVRAESGR